MDSSVAYSGCVPSGITVPLTWVKGDGRTANFPMPQ